MPLLFPHALGNVLRHNGSVKSRTDGVLVMGNRRDGEDSGLAAVMGTIAEFNLVRDALCGFRLASSVEGVVLRRNHVYFWYPVNNQAGERVAFQIDSPQTLCTLENNSVEGIQGVFESDIIPVRRGDIKESLDSQ